MKKSNQIDRRTSAEGQVPTVTENARLRRFSIVKKFPSLLGKMAKIKHNNILLTVLLIPVIASVCVIAVSENDRSSRVADIVVGYGEHVSDSSNTQDVSSHISSKQEASSDTIATNSENTMSDETDKALQEVTSDKAPEPAPQSSSNVFNVTFDFYNRESVSCTTSSSTVGEIASLLGIYFDENNYPEIDAGTTLSSDTTVFVNTVTYATDSVSSVIDYGTDYIESQTVPYGQSQTVSDGTAGELITEYSCKYLNGIEIERTESGSYVNVSPVNAVVATGIGGTFVGGDGIRRSYSYYIDVQATVYYVGGTCATGLPADENVIAVDPSVIPLWSRVYITGDAADVGERIAADTGGSIVGNIIDICIDPNTSPLVNFGFKPMRVYILN